ncbi:helix-turn-helix domain-containing protein [Streptomyces nodosus]
MRLRRAKALLAGGTAPSSTAAETGFADQAHLTRCFTRTYGMTPSAYLTAVHGGQAHVRVISVITGDPRPTSGAT